MENHEDKHKDWLTDLTGQSWNLEMLISGVAIFSTSFLPTLIEDALESYFQNYLSSAEQINMILPMLAYGFAKAVSYLLITTFFVHFILRAFWVSLVGLRAVYPEGIQYDKLPNTNDQLREQYRRRFGSLDAYIVRLDKLCSRLYAIAFVLVLFSIMMALVYLTFFLIVVGIRLINKDLYNQYKDIVAIVVFVLSIAFSSFFLLFTRKSMREHPRWGKIYPKVIASTEWMYFGTYRPLNYINFVFASNLPSKKYYTYFTLLMSVLFVVAFSIYTSKLIQYRDIRVLEPRDYYNSSTAAYQLNNSQYDNLRLEEESIGKASIQSDMISEPFVKLFIAYPKILDEDLHQLCKLPTPPDSLKNSEKRAIKDKARLACLHQYFQVAINDSVYTNTAFLYELHGKNQTKGITTYLPTNSLQIGRNTLSIKVVEVDSLPKKTYKEYATIPFWYAPEN